MRAKGSNDAFHSEITGIHPPVAVVASATSLFATSMMPAFAGSA
jgi:hypothetical protein